VGQLGRCIIQLTLKSSYPQLWGCRKSLYFSLSYFFPHWPTPWTSFSATVHSSGLLLHSPQKGTVTPLHNFAPNSTELFSWSLGSWTRLLQPTPSSPTHSWPEWTSSHQCTSWPFCPLDGLRFFIPRQMVVITVHFFLLLTTVPFFFFFFFFSFFRVLGRFSPGPDLPPCSLSYPHKYCTNLGTLFIHSYPNN